MGDATNENNSHLAHVPRRSKYTGHPYFYVFTYADRTDWLIYAVGFVAAAISGGIFPVLDLVYGYWTNAVVANESASQLRSTTNTMAGVCVAIGVLQLTIAPLFLCCFMIASGRITNKMRRAYLNAILLQDAEFFEQVGAGEVGTRMLKDIGTIKAATGDKLGFVCSAFTTLVVAVIMAFCRAPRLAGVSFGVVPLTLILFVGIGYLSLAADSRLLEVTGQAGTLLEQILSSIRVVQSFAAESFLARKYGIYLLQIQKFGAKRSLVRGLEFGTIYCILNLTYSVCFWYGSKLVVSDEVGVGLMFTVFWNMFNAVFSIATILPHISAIRDSVSTSEKIIADIERIPTIGVSSTDGAKLWSRSDDKSTPVEVEYRNVTFSYPSRPNHKSLDDVSLKLEPGAVTAVVGASGSGKSTLASLLLRYYDPVRSDASAPGRILVAGHDLGSLSLSWIRSQIGYVAQDPQLFTASIFDNVAYGLSGTPWQVPTSPSDPNYESRLSEAQVLVERALKQAQAWEFVRKLPEGLETRISGGRTDLLSGGQKQRIAVARALVRKPRILVLDEGTSALDSETEQRLMLSIHEEQKQTGMTTMLIAHRLSSIQNADQIIVMSNGRVTEQGTYQELMISDGVFKSLVRHQATNGRDTHSQVQHSNQLPIKEMRSRESNTSLPGLATYKTDSEVAESMERGQLRETSRALASRFFRLIWGFKKWLIVGTLASFCVGAAFTIVAWLIGFVVKGLGTSDDDQHVLSQGRYWSMWFLVLAIITTILSGVSGFFFSSGGDRIDRQLQLTSLHAILQQEVGFFDNEENAPGALTAAVASCAGNVSSAVGLIWPQVIVSCADFIGGIILSLVLSWKLALPCIAPIPFLLAAAYYNVAYLERYEHDVQKPLEEASAFASEHVDAIKTVAAYGRETSVIEQYDLSASRNIANLRHLLIGAIGFGVGVGFSLVLCAIVMWWGVELFVTHRITLARFFSTFEAILIAGFTASRIFTFVPDLARMMHGFRRVCSWEDREPQIASLASGRSFQTGDVKGTITFKECTLKYESRPQPAIENLNLVIPAGNSVAFCGPSGGGKSSIISLISRFYDPIFGTISLDNQDIRSIPLDQYRSQIALVSQNAILYEGTFGENITLGQDCIPQEVVERACRDASILDFILSLPQGFDTPVGFKGSQMSGGQRQRICIARALLRDPKILLLDEATSALDTESERSVQQALEQASKGRTTITIAHRLSTIRGADMIHVVEDGRIIESGTHETLLALGGRYVDLIRSQL
ncbi:ABC transporter transmembrane region [Ceratobasidium sp. AG-Ba]|nr:ABC transporter transmembrane region [Ceratobasidium sp. AG-Ba]